MRKVTFRWATASRWVLLVGGLLLFALNANAQCVAVDGGVQTQTLYAGQTIEIGTVSMEVVNDDLVITYQTDSGWQLQETHLWVGDDLADMPQTRKGNPKIGNFPFNSGDISGESNRIETIALNLLGFSCPSNDSVYYVAAHAAVQLVDGSGNVVQTETAWSEGSRYVERGMWGTYSSLPLTCDCGTIGGPTTGGVCETAYAYGGGTNAVDGDITNSFLDIVDEDGGSFNRWGWSNGAISEGTYEWKIYAGAGQSDITKGTHVGTLWVIYEGATAEVTFEMFEPYFMEENHVYVGNDILARDNGKFTVAPGQYGSIHDQTNGIQEFLDTHVLSASGEIYIVAHATVCGFEE